jgi:hypothetical protein
VSRISEDLGFWMAVVRRRIAVVLTRCAGTVVGP